MEPMKQSLSYNARLLKTKVSKQAIFGLIVGLISVAIATVLVSYSMTGSITLEGIIKAQSTNAAIWFLDISPFFFSFWGQYINSIIAYEASAMIIDETRELRMQTNALETQVAHDMTHDSLTGLPNNILFMDRLNQSLANLRHEKMYLAVCIISVDHLKEINNSLGRYNGDRILKQIAIRLASVLQEPNTVARTGDTSFSAILLKINSEKEAIQSIKKIHIALKTPFVLEDLSLNIQANVGAALSPEHGVDADTLIQRAEIAMDIAQQDFEETIVYNEKLDKNSQRRLILVTELKRAIEQDNLLLYYQPKVSLKNDALSFEALVRWQHPQYGLILPDDFVPLAERNGLSMALSTWVINKTLEQCARYKNNHKKITFSANLSALNLMDIDLPDKVAGQLAKYDLPSGSLILEITESATMMDQDRALQILKRLVDLGIEISIDDFGTGYSSLAYLSKLPASELKIDKSFVKNLSHENSRSIIKAIIALAHNLKLSVVAEGVETQETFNQLKELDCDWIQGHYISPPLNVEELGTWLTTSSWNKSN